MEPCSKSGRVFIFDIHSEYHKCRALYGIGIAFLGLQTYCNQWIKCHTVVTLHFLTKTRMGATEDFI